MQNKQRKKDEDKVWWHQISSSGLGALPDAWFMQLLLEFSELLQDPSSQPPFVLNFI